MWSLDWQLSMGGGRGGGKVGMMAKKVSFTAYSSRRLQLLQIIFV